MVERHKELKPVQADGKDLSALLGGGYWSGSMASQSFAHVPQTNAWRRSHPPASLHPQKAAYEFVTLQLCLFGMPGVDSGYRAVNAVASAKFSAKAAHEAAMTHIMAIVQPAEAKGHNVSVYLHGWLPAHRNDIKGALARAYGRRLLASAFDEPTRLRDDVEANGYNHSGPHNPFAMVRSMTAVLDLARRRPPSAQGAPSLAMLMRHDAHWFRKVDLAELHPLPAGAIVTGTWCNRQPLNESCAPLVLTRFNGVHDYFLIGHSTTLEWFVGSLAQRIRAQRRASKFNGHFMFQEHAESLCLPQRGLWLSHPGMISYMTYTLHRWRGFELTERTPRVSLSDRLSLSSRALGSSPRVELRCDGRVMCYDPERAPALQSFDQGPF